MLTRCFVQLINPFIPLIQKIILIIEKVREVLFEYISMNRSIVQGDCKILRANLLKDALENSFSDGKSRVGLHEWAFVGC